MARGLKHIAEEAGVSISTVSHVLNGTASISGTVQKRVLEVARQTGYLERRRKKATISALRSIVLGVPEELLPQNDLNFVSWTMLNALRQECGRRGVRIVPDVSPGRALNARQIVRTVKAAATDGLVLLHDDDPKLLGAIHALDLPTVLINGQDPSMRIDSVSAEDRYGARLGTQWLIDLGHADIRHITWAGRQTIRQRGDGFRDAMTANGLISEAGSTLLIEGFEPDLAEAGLTAWLQRNGGLGSTTAFFCAADNIALGAMRALLKAGYAIPGDVSVLGFDDIMPGQLATPPLSTVHIPLDQIGNSALGLLEDRLLDPNPDRAARRLELGCRIVERASVARPRAAIS